MHRLHRMAETDCCPVKLQPNKATTKWWIATTLALACCRSGHGRVVGRRDPVQHAHRPAAFPGARCCGLHPSASEGTATNAISTVRTVCSGSGLEPLLLAFCPRTILSIVLAMLRLLPEGKGGPEGGHKQKVNEPLTRSMNL